MRRTATAKRPPAADRERPGPGDAPEDRERGEEPGGWSWLADPRSAVLLLLGAVVLVGGGRRLIQRARARRSVDRLGDADVTPEAILASAEHGREGLLELFRLLTEGRTEGVRHAAGRALAAIWARDDLIPEEEQAVVRRGFEVRWRARRRYPRRMGRPIPIGVTYGLPFLGDGGPGVRDEQLEWSHRIAGAERAALEAASPWRPGPVRAEFDVDPADFDADGPHRLVLQPRARTTDALTSDWEIELPHAPFTFEFDPKLEPSALFTLPDVAKREAIAEAVRLEPSEGSAEGGEPRFLGLDGSFVLRSTPVLRVRRPLPSDLAHRVAVEFEGVAGRFDAGIAVVLADGPGERTIPLGPIEGLPGGAIERPGEVRLRAHLEPDADLGWAEPDARSLWPEPIATGWITARAIRR